jgi:hypothetical protein
MHVRPPLMKLGPSKARISHSPSELGHYSWASSSYKNADPHHHRSPHLLPTNPRPLHHPIEELSITPCTQHSHSGIRILPS